MASFIDLNQYVWTPPVSITSDNYVFTTPTYTKNIITPQNSPINPYTYNVKNIQDSNLISPVSIYTVSTDYLQPVVGFYETIDNEPSVRETMGKYFYDVIRDDWLLRDLSDILNYFKYTNGQVSFIEGYNQYNPSNTKNDTNEIAEKKVKFITKNVLTRYDLYDLMDKFKRKTGIKIVDIPKHTYLFKKVVSDYLMKKIKKHLK